MITLSGTYADLDVRLHYVCRVFRLADRTASVCVGASYVDGVGKPVAVRDGDVLLVCGSGTWFALYRFVG
ncbi:MAG: hypothetical protein QOE70_734 [Chthoniobacter sp.]|jgi:hypothetical protein|nr:hypothetical protein [Chthoniobacter sp.]